MDVQHAGFAHTSHGRTSTELQQRRPAAPAGMPSAPGPGHRRFQAVVTGWQADPAMVVGPAVPQHPAACSSVSGGSLIQQVRMPHRFQWETAVAWKSGAGAPAASQPLKAPGPQQPVLQSPRAAAGEPGGSGTQTERAPAAQPLHHIIIQSCGCMPCNHATIRSCMSCQDNTRSSV